MIFKVHTRFTSRGWIGFLGLFCLSLLFERGHWATSRIEQTTVPSQLQTTEGAILEENDVFFTFMTERAVRTLSKKEAQIVERDSEGDLIFIREHRNRNGDYWYWAHQKAREALVFALGRQPKEAIRTLDQIPFSEALLPQYRWIASLQFREFLETADDEILYYYDPYVALEVFLTNYQVSQLEREYPVVRIGSGRQARYRSARIPILDIRIRDLVATPRSVEEEGKVGLDAILDLPGGGVTESLLPSSKEYQEREAPIQERLITASDFQLKRIPVSSREARDLLQPLLSNDMRFLMIQGSMKESRTTGTRFTEDLKIVANPDSGLSQFLSLHKVAFEGATVKRAD